MPGAKFAFTFPFQFSDSTLAEDNKWSPNSVTFKMRHLTLLIASVPGLWGAALPGSLGLSFYKKLSSVENRAPFLHKSAASPRSCQVVAGFGRRPQFLCQPTTRCLIVFLIPSGLLANSPQQTTKKELHSSRCWPITCTQKSGLSPWAISRKSNVSFACWGRILKLEHSSVIDKCYIFSMYKGLGSVPSNESSPPKKKKQKHDFLFLFNFFIK